MSTHHETAARGVASYADMASRVAAIVSSSGDRLLKLQSEAGGAAFADNAQALHAALNATGGPAASIAAWPGLCQANVVRVLEVSRRWMEIMSQAQAEMAKLMAERLAVSGIGMPLDLGQFTIAMVDGRDAAMAGIQEFLATAGVPVIATGAKKR
ncbi:MAG TPA: TIGR01841 family phasin [Burkholderiales bacterium]|nr:TIGR01841 family phasin [Burkholderiales bacterium]